MGLYRARMSFEDEMGSAFRSGVADELIQQTSLAEIERARSAGDFAAEVSALSFLARLALRRGDYATCADLADEARTVARNSGDWRLDRWPLHIMASAARLAGDLDRARDLFTESLLLNERLGDGRVAAGERHNLGYVELHAGNAQRAREMLLAAREDAVRNDYQAMLPATAIAIAVVAALDGEHARAAELLGAADRVHQDAGIVPDPDDAFERQTARDQLIDVLGQERFEAAYANGFAPAPID